MKFDAIVQGGLQFMLRAAKRGGELSSLIFGKWCR